MGRKIADKPGHFGRLFQRFEDMKEAQQGVSWRTIEIYENSWKFFKVAFEEDDDIYQAPPTSQKDKERKIFDRLLNVILQRKRSGKPLSPVSINTYSRTMNTFLRWLQVEEGEFQFLWQLKKQKVETGDTREIFREDEITEIRMFKPASFNQRRAWTIAMLMFDVGLRIDEALSLRLEDIKFRDDLIFINGKGNKKRHVGLSCLMKPILHRYTDKFMPPSAKYVFGTHTGTKVTQRNALRDIGVVLRKSKVRELSWHSCRHTYATGYLRRGGRIEKLQKLLGHSRIETTMIYLHMVENYFTQGSGDFSSLRPM